MTEQEFLLEFRSELSKHSEQIAVQSVNVDYIKGSVDEIKDVIKDHHKTINIKIDQVETDIKDVEKAAITKRAALTTLIVISTLLGIAGTIMALN